MLLTVLNFTVSGINMWKGHPEEGSYSSFCWGTKRGSLTATYHSAPVINIETGDEKGRQYVPVSA